mmetsp:Transcript_1137/g.2124  ORF Transcript_1137/g.2124 Transcript_1137/m.2124 type:complete len:88 (+) Transcript_1137:735-998(+)
MIGQSLFLELVRRGDEKLVRAVDFVKGNLVHDIIGMVQCILDDHLKVNPNVHADLLKKVGIAWKLPEESVQGSCESGRRRWCRMGCP